MADKIIKLINQEEAVGKTIKKIHLNWQLSQSAYVEFTDETWAHFTAECDGDGSYDIIISDEEPDMHQLAILGLITWDKFHEHATASKEKNERRLLQQLKEKYDK